MTKVDWWYSARLGKPNPIADLRSEWHDWFLNEIDGYAVHRGLALWALGGAGIVLKTEESTIYVDPYCGGSLRTKGLQTLYRMIPIPFNPSDIKTIDAAVITHEDPDHLDETFVFPTCKNTTCVFVGPRSVVDLLQSWNLPKERIVFLKEYEEKKINDVRIVALPSYDPNSQTANTYVFEVGNVRVFHAGDAAFFDRYVEIGEEYDIDIALINLGSSPRGMKPYNNPGDVVQIARDLKARIVIPMHWDLWDFSLENPYLVEREIRLRKLDIRTLVLRIGERFDYP